VLRLSLPWLVMVAIGTAAGAAVGTWWARHPGADPSRPDGAASGRQAAVVPGRVRTLTTSGLAALAAARARNGAAAPIVVPELDELTLQSLDDRRVAAIRFALTREVGRRVYAPPPCAPPGGPRTKLRLPFVVSTDGERSGSAVLDGSPEIASGAPVDPSTTACLVGRLAGALVVHPAPGAAFLAGFRAAGGVTIELP